MVCTSWTKAVRYDPIALLKMVGVMDNEDEGNRVLEVVLEAARSEDNELLEELSDPEIRAFKSGIEKATVSLQSSSEGNTGPEQLFFLKARCQSVIDSKELTSSQKDSITSKLIPEIPVLCESFEKHATKLMKAIEDGDEDNQDVESFICLQLLQIAKYADIKEEGSRRHFTYVMKQMLSSVDTPDDLVEGCIQALHMTYDNEAEFVTSVCEILGDIRSAVDNQDVNEDAAGTLETMHTLRILSILSVLLETASVQLSNNPAVSQFAKHIVPSVTHSDVLIREAAVGCFGKLGLFTSEDTVMNEFKPILLEVANSTEERMEIRAQALLALSDWSMLFSDILKPCEIGEKTVSFSELVTNMMSDSRTAAVCIAAEVAAKLSFSGKVCDSSWLAHLLAIYFDPRMIDLMEEDEDIKEVGSAVRLQQLLTIFFPAYCMKSELGRDAFVGSILPMLELIYFEPPKTSHKGKKTTKKKVTWPVVKMIQYVCSMVDYGKNSVVSDDATVVQADKAPEQGDDTSTEATAQDGTNNSASLMAGVQIASFLAKHGEDINVTTLRALCKHLGASEFDLNKEDRNKLVALKTDLEELGMVITDANSLRSLSDLNDLLADIHVDDEDEEPSDEEQEERNAGEDSDATESENDEEEAASEDEDDIAAPASKINLSNDLVAALNGVKIAGDEDSGVFDNAEKENSGKRTSKGKGRKNSSGSAASRRSRLKRLSDISAN